MDDNRMYRSSDITNLFRKFGASADSYKEIDCNFDYIEEAPLPARAPEVAAAYAMDAPAASAPAASPEPSIAESEVPPAAVSASRSLSDLLADTMKRREGNQPELLPVRQNPGLSPKVIALVSAKGGVGKSTLVAALTLARSLQRNEGRTLAIDLDPQNALYLHLGGDAEQAGLIQAEEGSIPWSELLHRGYGRSQCLPYGPASVAQQRALEQSLRDDPHWLTRHLAAMGLGTGDTVIVDTPAGASPYLDQVLTVADQVLVVTLPDAASYHSLSQVERLLDACQHSEHAPQRRYLINQLDSQRPFSLAMCEVLMNRFGRRLLGVVHLDHHLSESLAHTRNPLADVTDSQGCRDILEIADTLGDLLRQHGTEESIPS